MVRGPIERVPTEDRFRSKVDTSAGPLSCWPWMGAVNPKTGYGVFHPGVRSGLPLTINAHRMAAYMAGIIELDDPRHVDHTCHNDAGCPPGPCLHRLCQNPSHFEVVSNRTNVNRSHNSNIRKTHCPRGHEYTPENTRIQVRANTESRKCRACEREKG